MVLPINRIGRIAKGSEEGKYIKILDDRANSGGFLVLTASDLDFHVGHDNWVESKAALLGYFRESGWLIDWLD